VCQAEVHPNRAPTFEPSISKSLSAFLYSDGGEAITIRQSWRD
jgi:hypothetical protein